jgi:hypothetical protein
MHRGTRTRDDATNGGNKDEHWVRKLARTMPTFDPEKEKEAYQREIRPVLGQYWGASTSSTPHIEDHARPYKPLGEVIPLI